MEPETPLIGPLLEKAEAYGKTSVELLKLKTVEATADLGSVIAFSSFLFIALLLFTITVSMAAVLWLGDVLGKTYYGFLVVAALYALVALLLLLSRNRIKTRINNSLIGYLTELLCKK